MKKIFQLVLILGSTAFLGCEEIPPPVDFAETEEFITETYILGSINQPKQDKHALIEDLTGVRCPNCPDATKRAKEIKSSNPNRVHLVGLYTSQPVNLTFPFPNEQDLTTEHATNIYTNIFGSPALPGGGVNRRPAAGENTLNQVHALWGSSTQKVLTEKSDVMLEPSLTALDDSTWSLLSTFTFMEEMPGQTFVSIMLLEDDIEGSQATDTGEIHDYVHEHVMRTMYTPYNGRLLFSDAEKGRVLKGEWTLSIPSAVKPENASLLIFVNRNDAESKEILQVMEVKP